MKLLFRSVRIFDKTSPFNGKTVDLYIDKGQIADIGDDLQVPDAKIFEVDGLCISPGWFDMRTALRDPGREQEEDFRSLRETAAHGGYTGLLLLPNSQPAIDTKGALKYVLKEGQGGAVEFFPTATVTKGAEGKDFTEMIDLHQAGAIAFTDGVHPLHNSDIFLKTLQYLQPLKALLINRPEDQYLSLYGQMHEGITSTTLGLKGIPSLSEEMMIVRDLQLLEYVLEGQDYSSISSPMLHFSLLSTVKAVELIREAKKKGLPVSADIAAHQLAFTDEALTSFNTNLKVNPPFRTEADREALKEGLADGTIDLIVSDHTPSAPQNKDTEFDHSEFGITSLETTFAVARKESGLSLEDLIDRLSHSARKLLQLSPVSVTRGAMANLTFFLPDEEWVFETSYSKSQNTPFLNQTLTGKVKGVINRGELNWF